MLRLEERNSVKYTLYIPSKKMKDKWDKYAERNNMSLALFIRLAVEKEISRIKDTK